MPNRETRRRVDLDARRAERKNEVIEAKFLDKIWVFPAKPSLAAIVAIEEHQLGAALRLLLGAKKANEIIANPEVDIDDLKLLLDDVYEDSAEAGEAPASSDS